MKWFSINKRYRLKLMLAGCLLSTIPILIIGVAFYSIASSSLQTEVGRAKREAMKQVQERIDDKLVTLNKTVIQHLFASTLDKFMHLDMPHDDFKLYQETISMLNSIEVLVDNVESASIYMNKHDLVMSVVGGLQEGGAMNQELRDKLRTNREPFFWFVELSDKPMTRGDFKNITYVRQIPVRTEQSLGYIIVKLTDRVFFQVYSELDRDSSGEMLIATTSGSVFSDWKKSLLQDDFSSYAFIGEIQRDSRSEGSYIDRIDGQNMLINYVKSPYNEWKYISVIPIHELSHQLDKVKNVTLLLCLALIAGSLLISLLLSKHFYQVINNIVDFIRGKQPRLPLTLEKRDEMSLIKHYMESLHELNQSLNEQVEKSKPELAASFVRQMLTESAMISDVEEKFDYYGLPQRSPYYTVMCIELDLIEGLSEQDVNLLLYGVKNIAEELLGSVAPGVVVKLRSQQLALIVNHDEGESPVKNKVETYRLAEQINAVVTDMLKFKTTIGVGRCHTGIQEMRHSLNEALHAVQYKLIVGTGKVISVDQVEPSSGSHSFSYPYELEQQLMLQVKLGNEVQITELLQQFGSELTRKEGLSAERVRMSFMQLISRALRELYELDPEKGPSLYSYNLYERVNEWHTISDILKWMQEDIFPVMSRHIKSCRNDNNNKSIQRVLRHIERHYGEELSQPMMAELCEMPPSLFSQIFKDEVGLTFSDYLISFRMKKARVMLVETDLKIAQISERLCYNNPQNFIRVFKKMNGMPPGEYRSLHKLHESGAAQKENE